MADIAATLPAVPESIPRSRELLEALRGHVDDAVLQDLRLIVSELVTNSVRHAGLRPADEIDLVIAVGGDRIRLEIRDPGPGFEPPGAPTTLFQESGWGLFLVSRLADRWGVATRDGHTVVWIEIRRTSSG